MKKEQKVHICKADNWYNKHKKKNTTIQKPHLCPTVTFSLVSESRLGCLGTYVSVQII